MQISGLGFITLCMGLTSVVFRSGWARHMAKPIIFPSLGSVHFWKNFELVWGSILALYGLVVLTGIHDPKSHLKQPFPFPDSIFSFAFSFFLFFLAVYSTILLKSCVRAAVEEHDGILGIYPSKAAYTVIALSLISIQVIVGGLGFARMIVFVL